MPTHTTSPSVLIRAARGSDGPALRRLAALDSSSVPSGDLLVAETEGGELIAALGADARIAAPSRRSGDVIELLELRAAGPLAARRRSRSRRLALRPAVRAL